jgi:hypothetical protein
MGKDERWITFLLSSTANPIGVFFRRTPPTSSKAALQLPEGFDATEIVVQAKEPEL